MREHRLELPREVAPKSVIAYSRLFQIENWFRELVYLESKAHFGKQWWFQAEKALKRHNSPGIPADKSILRDKKHPHMSTPENDPLWFLSFDSLLKIVFDPQLWPLFECYLTTRELLEAKFWEIIPIRNRVSHNRRLHDDDLDRLRRVLRDLDQGFWRFCTSFNETRPFIGDLETDPIYVHFRDRMGFDYAQVGANEWALVGSTIGMRQNLMVEYSYRPSAAQTAFPQKGRLYHFTFLETAHNRRALDYPKILKYSKRFHAMVVYIILDAFQYSLRVSIPALYSVQEIIGAAECFYYACGNLFSFSIYDQMKERTDTPNPMEDYEAMHLPFETIAAQWPHYVIPPGHPFEVLGPDCPCSFFEA